MLSLCLDTNTYSAFRRAQPDVVQILSSVDHVWMPVTVLAELRAGFLSGNRNAANELALQAFLDSPSVTVAVHSATTSRYYAAVHHQLKRDGKFIPVNDVWIAACALEHQCPIFTFDAHFHRVNGVQVVASVQDWLALK
jgi:tRNA(fMet)-specific endonuclease VapC